MLPSVRATVVNIDQRRPKGAGPARVPRYDCAPLLCTGYNNNARARSHPWAADDDASKEIWSFRALDLASWHNGGPAWFSLNSFSVAAR